METAHSGDIDGADNADQKRGSSFEEHSARQAKAERGKAAYGKLPNSVAINPGVSAENLILLAYRTTWIKWDHSTRGHNVLVRGGGLGRDVVERANTEAVALGLLDRHQPGGRPGSKYRYAVETLTLPAPGVLGRRMVRRQWFTGILSKIELAALLYIRAAGRVMRRELAERFGWSPTTAKLALDGLAGIVLECPTRTPDGAFGPTFYKAIPRVPSDLHGVLRARRALKSKQSVKSHHQKPGHGSPGDGTPGHVRSYAEDLSELNLAALDSENPPPTSRSEELSDRTPPPAASPSSAGGDSSPSARKAKVTLTDWEAAPFFQREHHFVLPDTGERVTDLAGWRAMIGRHGGAPNHLLTPFAWRQAEHLAQHLSTQSTEVPIDTVLDAVAYWVAEYAGRGRTIRSLALIGQALYADLESGSGGRVFDRPSSLSPARYEEVSRLATTWVTAISGCATVDEMSLTSTYQIEVLAAMLDRCSQQAVVDGINRTTQPWRDAGKPGPEGRTITGWTYFERNIDSALLWEQQYNAKMAAQRKKLEAYRACVRGVAPMMVRRLETEGAGLIQINRESLLSWQALNDLAHTLEGAGIELEQAESALHKFVDAVIKQQVTPLASWRKTIVRLVANTNPDEGGRHEQTASQ